MDIQTGSGSFTQKSRIETCESCYHWFFDPHHSTTGHCKRLAGMSFIMVGTDFCSKWMPKKTTKRELPSYGSPSSTHVKTLEHDIASLVWRMDIAMDRIANLEKRI